MLIGERFTPNVWMEKAAWCDREIRRIDWETDTGLPYWGESAIGREEIAVPTSPVR